MVIVTATDMGADDTAVQGSSTEETVTSPLSPLAPYPPYPPSHKSRAPEFYGFVTWILTLVLFVLYVLWAILPDESIEWLGVYWFPSREWAILLPSYSIILILLTYFTYWALAIYATPSFDDLSTIIDSKTQYSDSPNVADASSDTIHKMQDMPIGLVNRALYRANHETNHKDNSVWSLQQTQ